MRYFMTFSYDGSDFKGYQKQPKGRTVQGEIESVLKKINGDKAVKITATGRTDAGVHALNQKAHFDFEEKMDIEKLLHSMNSMLPEDIYIKHIEEVSDNFHARFDATGKEYIYQINMGEYNPTRRNYELEYNKKINIKLLKKASKYLVGEHDFKSFTSDSMGKNTIRRINYIKFKKNKELLIISIEANGFLKYMIRNIIGLFLEINENKKTPIMTKEILESKDRTKLGIKAPSSGLYLNKIKY